MNTNQIIRNQQQFQGGNNMGGQAQATMNQQQFQGGNNMGGQAQATMNQQQFRNQQQFQGGNNMGGQAQATMNRQQFQGGNNMDIIDVQPQESVFDKLKIDSLNFSNEHPILTGVLVGGTIYAGYKILKSLLNNDSDDSSSIDDDPINTTFEEISDKSSTLALIENR